MIYPIYTPANMPDYEIDIQKYLNVKLQELLSSYDILDFGSLKELFFATDNFYNTVEEFNNNTRTQEGGGVLNIKDKIMSSFKSLLSKKSKQSKINKSHTKKPIVSIFDSRINWSTFKEYLHYNSDEETIFDVINNEEKKLELK